MKKDNRYTAISLATNWTKRTYKFAHHYHFSLHFSSLDCLTKGLDTWVLLKIIILGNSTTIVLLGLTGSGHSLLIVLLVDAFCGLFMVYPVTNTQAQVTNSVVVKWIHSLRSFQSCVHERSTAFINADFIN